MDVRFKLQRCGCNQAFLHVDTPVPHPFPLFYDLLTCVDPTFLGTDGTRKAATEPAMASVLTTVPFIASELEGAVCFCGGESGLLIYLFRLVVAH